MTFGIKEDLGLGPSTPPPANKVRPFSLSPSFHVCLSVCFTDSVFLCVFILLFCLSLYLSISLYISLLLYVYIHLGLFSSL